MTNTGDIHKTAGIIIENRKVVLEKDVDKDYFISPGGKIEPGETPEQTLVRELNEELTIDVDIADLEPFGQFTAPAVGQEHRTVYMQVFLVKKYSGHISLGHKVDQLLWVNSDIPTDITVGSIFAHEVIPRLKAKNLID